MAIPYDNKSNVYVWVSLSKPAFNIILLYALVVSWSNAPWLYRVSLAIQANRHSTWNHTVLMYIQTEFITSELVTKHFLNYYLSLTIPTNTESAFWWLDWNKPLTIRGTVGSLNNGPSGTRVISGIKSTHSNEVIKSTKKHLVQLKSGSVTNCIFCF